jgi:uncharacterized protein (TIGR02679 family)
VTGRAVQRLSRPELTPLVDALARRFGEGDTPASITLRSLPEAARSALADLLGADRIPLPGGRLRLERLATALGLSGVAELRVAVEGLRGPVPDRRAEREAARTARQQLWVWLAEEAARLPIGGGAGGLRGWVEGLRAAGIRGGVDVHRQRLTAALAVLRALPADGVPLASLAADKTGDPHALDHGRALAAIVLDAVAVATGASRQGDAETARRLWETVAVEPDPLSSTVLALGLPGDDATPLGRWVGDATEAGEPVVLSLANLRRWPVGPSPAGSPVFVVENPALVAEAAGRGWSGPPLVCSSGRPTVAVLALLRQLGAGGAAMHQHADFDPAGLAITAWLAERAGTTPWRMTAADYLAASGRVPSRPRFDAPVPATPWDPALAGALRTEGIPVYEEELRVELLAGMQADQPPPASCAPPRPAT